MSSQQQIIERIKKLEALAVSEKKIGNIQASKTAQDKANSLKQKYNISNAYLNPQPEKENSSTSEYRFSKKVRFRSNEKTIVIETLQMFCYLHDCYIETCYFEVVEKKFFFFDYKTVVNFTIIGNYKNLVKFRDTFYKWINEYS